MGEFPAPLFHPLIEQKTDAGGVKKIQQQSHVSLKAERVYRRPLQAIICWDQLFSIVTVPQRTLKSSAPKSLKRHMTGIAAISKIPMQRDS
jgi:hypothetical protein